MLAIGVVLQPGCGGEKPSDPPAPAVSRNVEPRPVVEGMTMEEVLSLWGSPSVKVRESAGERWSYWLRDSRHRVVGKTYVLFDDDKRVSEVIQAPDGVPDPAEKAPLTITGGSLRAPAGARSETRPAPWREEAT